nr:truncated envelope glycoprotein [Porcine endogenous retrovirus]
MHPTLNRCHLPIRGGKPKRLKIPLSFASIAWFLTLSITPQVNGKCLVDSRNSHKPLSLTWLLTDSGTGININSTQGEAPLRTWWPELYVCLRSVIPGLNDQATPPDVLRAYGFYVCPGPPNNKKYCENPQDFFYKQRSCVTSNDGNWKWPVSQQDGVSYSFVNNPTTYNQFNYGHGRDKDIQQRVQKDVQNKQISCNLLDLDYLKISFTEKKNKKIFKSGGMVCLEKECTMEALGKGKDLFVLFASEYKLRWNLRLLADQIRVWPNKDLQSKNRGHLLTPLITIQPLDQSPLSLTSLLKQGRNFLASSRELFKLLTPLLQRLPLLVGFAGLWAHLTMREWLEEGNSMNQRNIETNVHGDPKISLPLLRFLEKAPAAGGFPHPTNTFVTTLKPLIEPLRVSTWYLVMTGGGHVILDIPLVFPPWFSTKLKTFVLWSKLSPGCTTIPKKRSLMNMTIDIIVQKENPYPHHPLTCSDWEWLQAWEQERLPGSQDHNSTKKELVTYIELSQKISKPPNNLSVTQRNPGPPYLKWFYRTEGGKICYFVKKVGYVVPCKKNAAFMLIIQELSGTPRASSEKGRKNVTKKKRLAKDGLRDGSTSPHGLPPCFLLFQDPRDYCSCYLQLGLAGLIGLLPLLENK